MPLLMDGNLIPPRWTGSAHALTRRLHNSSKDAHRVGPGIRVALINNMPDAALEDTEMQFVDLIDAASGEIPVRLSLYSLPEVPRGERAQQHIGKFYQGIDRLWNSEVNAVIITGAEPHQANLRQEPYWQSLAEVFDWAERHTVSAILSCLAAHAGVLHGDGIPRQPLRDKLFGVFESTGADHLLTKRAPKPLRFPHSRWNELHEQSLKECGYSVLTRSAQSGADLFVKRQKKSLFVYFQGHPEYSAQTLLKEYRRDVKRFLRGERETYPAMPQRYFDRASVETLTNFMRSALADRGESQIDLFPDDIAADPQNSWSTTGTCIYRNWMQYVSSRIGDQSALVAVAENNQAAGLAAGGELA